ncbi:TetR/AcrR family transcriptional regulator [Ferrimonas gelatinilytica]|uniref:TetR/AcrR family transcriptional regulator n=1 Tax=Ferrimonas gelatinilytica TaxID=1255257 RepID=A0ABP9SC36_9GAMM
MTGQAMEVGLSGHWGSPNQARFRQRDQVLIRLAERLIEQQGLVSFRFSELAPLAGCSAGTLYKHFASKEDLLIAIFARQVEGLVASQPHFLSCSLSHAECWIAMHLYAVMASQQANWSLGLNTLGGAPQVLEKASDFRVQELKMYLTQFYNTILRVIEGARIQGELCATDQQVQTVHTMLSYFQRGAAGTLENPLMEDAVAGLSARQLYDAFAVFINTLEWKQPLRVDSYSRIIAAVELQLSERQAERELLAVI